METGREPSHELMDDVRAVDWLPLEAAIERLSRTYERAFLANVGPLALEAAARARFQGRPKARKPPAPVKRRRRPAVAPPPPLTIPAAIAPPPDVMPPAIEADTPLMLGNDLVEVEAIEAQPVEAPLIKTQPAENQSVEVEAQSSDCVTAPGITPEPAEEISAATAAESEPDNEAAPATGRDRHVNLVQIVRDWLWRAA
jgi:8-oxo-dGTP diphosphatase